MVNGVETLRYYDVNKKLFKELLTNSRDIKRKVKRNNKYVNKKLVAGSLLSTFLLLSTIVGYKLLNKAEITSLKNEIKVTNKVKTTSNETISNILEFSNTDLQNKTTNYVVDRDVPDPNSFVFDYEDRSESDKAFTTRELYSEVITKYSNMYGLPSNLMVAVATQESGTHATEVSPGGGAGLFQIQVENGWGWLGKTIRAYNFETNQMEELIVGGESGDKNMLLDLDYNTKVACMIMAYDLAYCNYDIIAALQTYNSGTMVSVLKEQYGTNWLNYRNSLAGDPQYIEHVCSFIPKENSLLEYKDPTGNSYVVDVNNTYGQLITHESQTFEMLKGK